MNLEMSMALELVKEAEGFYPNTYHCPTGKLTQGYGRNLEVHPLTEEEKLELNQDGTVSEFIASKWALKELQECEEKLMSNIIYQKQTEVRKAVLLDMCFNIGYAGLMKFKKMWFALGDRDYITASREMKDSKYYTDVKSRGKRNVTIMASNMIVKKE
ncbi:MAG: glycoside hydrolase family protein [Sulfurospirillum sp.]